MPFPDPMKQATAEAFADPQVGDRFSEMFCFWLYVVGRDGDTVITMEANPPATLPKDGTVKVQTVDEFRHRFAYGNDPNRGYWVRLHDRGNNVAGWI